MRLLLQRLRGGRGLLHQRGVLLGALVHLRHGGAHFGNAGALLLAGAADFTDDARHAADALLHLLHGGACALHQVTACIHLPHRFVNQPLDFFGGGGAALGQLAHFCRHHGKAPALFARPRRLDGRIQRQDVGLESNAIDHLE